MNEGLWTVTVTQTDGDKNEVSAAASVQLDIDTTAPTVTITVDTGTGTGTIDVGDDAIVTFDFSEPIDATTFMLDDLGTFSYVTTGALAEDPDDNTIYTLKLTGATEGTSGGIRLAERTFKDIAGNDNTEASSTPAAAPTVTESRSWRWNWQPYPTQGLKTTWSPTSRTPPLR